MVYLIPSLLAVGATEAIPQYIPEKVKLCKVLFAENIRTARRFLKQLDPSIVIDNFQWFEIRKDEDALISDFRNAVARRENVGIISEAGCPAIADPGHLLVAEAHRLGIGVVPLVGPSSILLALMASGMNGQQFTFHGYLPINSAERIKRIKKLEEDALKTGYTQIFIETPYRNDALLKDMIRICNNHTILCVASELTGADERILSLPIRKWKDKNFSFHKMTAIFLLSVSDSQ